ncbi:hypothetical protein D088_290006 [Salmonella enterica subsp. houtenae serovar 16:z4,z32:-- str. RKS3027]|nr:hypothetical protein D088_290006 [Salmonella enterica subsp. houtenae serovar 16:z4,z32:-- str. RKS3027]
MYIQKMVNMAFPLSFIQAANFTSLHKMIPPTKTLKPLH